MRELSSEKLMVDADTDAGEAGLRRRLDAAQRTFDDARVDPWDAAVERWKAEGETGEVDGDLLNLWSDAEAAAQDAVFGSTANGHISLGLSDAYRTTRLDRSSQ